MTNESFFFLKIFKLNVSETNSLDIASLSESISFFILNQYMSESLFISLVILDSILFCLASSNSIFKFSSPSFPIIKEFKEFCLGLVILFATFSLKTFKLITESFGNSK